MRHKAILQFAIILVLAVPVTAAVIHVPADYPDIRSAVNHASNGDEIILANGVYSGENNRDIMLYRTLTIRSANGPDNCIIDCNSPGPEEHFAFEIDYGSVVLEGLSIINGNGHNGGAIICERKLTAVNCVFSHNSALEKGGTIFLPDRSQATIMNCRFTGNTAGERGGAVFCEGRACLTVMNSEFINNSTGESDSGGGAIACTDESQVTLMNSKLEGNSAGESGGAIYCSGDDGSLVIDKCSISDNTVNGDLVGGAGIFIKGDYDLNITDSVISRNVATSSGGSSVGGGLCLVGANGGIIKNCQITENVVRTESSIPNLYFCGGAGVSIHSKGGIIFVDCAINGNRVVAPIGENNLLGGGLFCSHSDPIFLRCRIQNNTARLGSGMCFFNESTPVISNCLISGNTGYQQGSAGGCIYFNDTDSKISSVMVNSTIVGNDSCGIDAPKGYSHSRPPKIHNCIVYNNGNCRGGEQIEGDFEVSYSCIQSGWADEGNINVDPCFVLPGYWDSNSTEDCNDNFWVEGDYHLRADSNCIDTGGVPIWYMDTTDLDGLPRIAGAKIDMGAYEYHNAAPVAVAGPDQVVYACFNELADVNLDGSGSYDDDGDELTCKWSWVIDSNNCEANSVAPAIKLPVGTHDIELIVHDGTEPSEPDNCIVEVIGGIEGKLKMMSRTINCRLRGQWITVILTLPAEINPEDISEEPLKLYPGGINSIYQKPIRWCSGKGVSIFAVFEKEAFCEAVEQSGQVEASAAGELISGRCFYGTGFVKVFE